MPHTMIKFDENKMKLSSIIVFVLLCLSDVSGQLIERYGFKIGAATSHQNWEYKPSSLIGSFTPANLFHMNAGLFAESAPVSFFRIAGEINYVCKGAQKDVKTSTVENPEGSGRYVTWKLGIDYINLSALIKTNLIRGSFSPYIIAGPRVDFEIAKAVENDRSSFYDDFNKTRPGYKIGLGADTEIGERKFLFEIIYDGDFSELYENSNVRVTTYSVDFRIGIIF